VALWRESSRTATIISSRKLNAGSDPGAEVWASTRKCRSIRAADARAPTSAADCGATTTGEKRRPPTPRNASALRRRPSITTSISGGPRSNKWINVTPLPKVWESRCISRGSTGRRGWIVNVGEPEADGGGSTEFPSIVRVDPRRERERTAEYLRLWRDAGVRPGARRRQRRHRREVHEVQRDAAKPEHSQEAGTQYAGEATARRKTVVADWNRDRGARGKISSGDASDIIRDGSTSWCLSVKEEAVVERAYVTVAMNGLTACRGAPPPRTRTARACLFALMPRSRAGFKRTSGAANGDK